MRFLIVCALCFFINATSAFSASYVIDTNKSSISFSGTHAGNAFTGTFQLWIAKVDFDPENPSSGSITATIDLSSATTGNTMYDGTLPQSDWFDIKNTPQATFTSTSIRSTGEGTYFMTGNLNLRGIQQPVNIPFTLTKSDNGGLTANAKLSIDRMTFNIGAKSDPKAEWVSPMIDVAIAVSAKKQED
jgi:polyisoprenoid-binding protein YceI